VRPAESPEGPPWSAGVGHAPRRWEFEAVRAQPNGAPRACGDR
jgi:hypothetical protein